MKLFRKKEDACKTQKCIFIAGFAGSGKTMISKDLVKELHYVYIDKDTVSRASTEYALSILGGYEGDRESVLYTRKIRHIEYETALDTVAENLKLGNNVIVSAPFISQINAQDWLKEIKLKYMLNENIQFYVVWVISSREVERDRIIRRGAIRDKWKLENWLEYCKSIESIEVNKNVDNIYFFENLINDEYNENFEELLEWIKK
jgi:predicted kinase